MDNEVLGLIVKELNKNGVNLIKHDFSNIDTFSPENVDYCYGMTGGLPQIFDFTEHDKGFKDEISDLRKELRESKACITQLKHELEEKCRFETDRLVKLPFDPLETANMLINATHKAKIPFMEKQVDRDIYSTDDLEQIAEHLLVYCKHNRESEE